MSYLLDTHCYLWWMIEPARLPTGVVEILSDKVNPIFFSAVSAWEIAIKVGTGKLALGDISIVRMVVEQPVESGLLHLPINANHAARVRALPPLHRDPFDRMLVAQAQVDGLTLLTCDAAVSAYPVDCFW